MSLKSLRQEKGCTQQVVADYLEITRAAYTNIENGKRNMDKETIVRLAEFYGVSTDTILEQPETETQPTAKYNELDQRLINLLIDLSPEEIQRVYDFVAGMKNVRMTNTSPQE